VPRARTALALALCALAPACGEEADELPADCRGGPGPILEALETAPRPVRLDGARISDCLSRHSDAGELQGVGTGLVEAAASLGPPARRHPGGPEAMRLGYLVGAARNGAAPTRGIHSELLRRLEQEAAGLDRSPAFRRGLRAGGRDG
jgi:hypothetical protein